MDSTLLAVASMSDERARKVRLERLIHSEYRMVWRLLRRLGVTLGSVDDATQQVFLILAERLDDIRPGSEKAFAFGTALRVAQAQRRRAAREPLALDPEQAARGPLPDELSDRRRVCERLDRVLDGMADELRSVFVLFELEGMTSPEIAQIAGLPLGTVASRLRRAREQFRSLVQASGAATWSGDHE